MRGKINVVRKLAAIIIIAMCLGRYGYDFDKPAAPLRLTAFLETLRRVNAEWTAHLVDELSKLSSSNPAAVALIDLLKDNRHFGDISSQIHYGDEVPPHMAAFHNDGPNSSIHLALSISGRRSLYWKGSKDPSFLEDVHSSKPSGYKTLEEKQGPGSVYLSSPFIVSHGVAYKESTWKDRIIALQCRCLFTRAEYDEMYKASEFEWRVTMETVTSCMGRLGEIDGSTIFRLPQLPHVNKVYAELYPQWQRYNEELIQTKTSATSGSQTAISLVTFMKQNPREGLPEKDNEPSEE